MKFQRELSWYVWDEIRDLLRLHWREIAHYQDIMLNPDEGAYNKLEEIGALRVFTARDDNQSIIGYAVFFVRNNLHYSDSLQAMPDVLFIHPDHRRGWLGFKFIRWCDRQLRDEGVQVAYHHVKVKHDFGPILERLGYVPIDVIYGRRLDHGDISSHRSGGSHRRRGTVEETGTEATAGPAGSSSTGPGTGSEAGGSAAAGAGSRKETTY